MHKQLVEYPQSLAQLSSPGIPALGFAWLDPLKKESSPYGIEVSKGLEEGVAQTSICIQLNGPQNDWV